MLFTVIDGKRFFMNENESGFSFIELMIVIVIIGILALIAIPAYQDTVIRTRVSEGLSKAKSAKLAVEETTHVRGSLPTNQAQTGYVSPMATDYVTSIVIRANGRITIRYTAAAGGGTIILRPTRQTDGSITWSCLGGSLSTIYRPIDCR